MDGRRWRMILEGKVSVRLMGWAFDLGVECRRRLISEALMTWILRLLTLLQVQVSMWVWLWVSPSQPFHHHRFGLVA